MSVIIRLQNLPWSANALDIRQFFSGLSIPEGGVHIVGGELGDAFIAFSTDEDARQAFNLNGGKIKEIQIKLMLSSRTEMQKVIEAARNPLAAFMQASQPHANQTLPAIVSAAAATALADGKKDLLINEKRDRRRSRSRSRDRKDRSRERERRDRRRRDRSRSRSRERRDRRRRDRSHSRERRSKERDRRSKDRKHSEENNGAPFNSNMNTAQNQTSKVVWEDPIRNDISPALQQAKVLLNSLLPNNLEEVNLTALSAQALTLARNGLQTQNELVLNKESWSVNNKMLPQENMRPEMNRPFERNFQGPIIDKSRYSKVNVPKNQISSEENSRIPFNKALRPDGRPSRFEMVQEKNNLNQINHPVQQSDRSFPPKRSPSDYFKKCCIQLQPFYGGYGEIRRFFQGLFIHSTGIKFVNDEYGKRTGIVFVRFATLDGKEKALLKDGSRLKMKIIEITELDDEAFDNAIDRYVPDHNRKQNHYLGDDDTFKHSEVYQNYNKTITHYSCLAVEDLPLFTKEQDMLKIFSDYSLLSILLINKQRHVTAYIKFSNPDDAKKAITEKSNHMFDGNILDLRPCSDEEYIQISKEEPDVQIIEDDEKPCAISECISLSGLPLKTTERDISDFFSDVAIVPNKINLVHSHLGFTGQAFCEFSSNSEASVALEKNGLPLGTGVITVTSVTRKDMETTIGSVTRPNININPNNSVPNRPFFPRGFGRGGHGPPMMAPRGLLGHRPPRRFMPPMINDMAPPGCTILMENVPYKSGLDEILEFFDGFDIPPDNVLRRYNENGTPSGEAKVIFNSADDAYQALQDCNQGKIRDRIVYLSQS